MFLGLIQVLLIINFKFLPPVALLIIDFLWSLFSFSPYIVVRIPFL